MRKIFLAIIISILSATGSSVYADDARWCAVSGSTVIALDDIECIVGTDGESTLSLLLRDGNVVANLGPISFDRYNPSQVVGIKEDLKAPEILMVHNSVLISRAMPSASVRVFSVAGLLLVEGTVLKDGSCSIDVSALENGVYLLNIGNVTVKFAKR